MSTVTTYESAAGSIIHIELTTDEPQATRSFYEDAFGWRFKEHEEMDYTTWWAPNPPSGGLMTPQEGPFTPPSTLFYIQVEDNAAARSAIREAGGTLLVEETEVPEMGVFTVFRDPGGVVAATWENRYEGEPPSGGWPMFTDEPDVGSLIHFELYSEDPEASQDFFEAIFDWGFEEMEDGAYTMCRPSTPPFGGVMEASDEMPAGTLAYVLVENATDACRTIETAGGTVLRDPFEIEGWGTMAVFEAPGGIVQAIWENSPDWADIDIEEETERMKPANP